jgi:hypothetical protein
MNTSHRDLKLGYAACQLLRGWFLLAQVMAVCSLRLGLGLYLTVSSVAQSLFDFKHIPLIMRDCIPWFHQDIPKKPITHIISLHKSGIMISFYSPVLQMFRLYKISPTFFFLLLQIDMDSSATMAKSCRCLSYPSSCSVTWDTVPKPEL